MERQVPAQTVEAIFLGMASLGMDIPALRARGALPAAPTMFGERWPEEALDLAWQATVMAHPRPTVGVEIALGIPFGAFGLVDYLIASADTMGGGLHALASHFRSITEHNGLTLAETAEGVRLTARARDRPMAWIGEEFLLAQTLKSLRHIAGAPVPVTALCTTRAALEDDALPAMLDVPVRFGCPAASLLFDPSVMSLPLRTADPQLHRAMGPLVASLQLGEAIDPLQQAIRARLRDVLQRGETSAAEVARTLGMSERTLQRRLKAQRTTWREVIDGFRCDESKRLLGEGRSSLAEIAMTVGFSEQTAWTRAFRRWTGRSPARWAKDAGRGS